MDFWIELEITKILTQFKQNKFFTFIHDMKFKIILFIFMQ
jgi:hypothetical protein